MKKLLIIISLFFLLYSAKSQTFTDSSLPIVIIAIDNNPATGQPYEIVNEPKVFGNMKIIYRQDGTRNYLSDQNTVGFLNYDGRVGIELRGSSSVLLPKKPYGLTTLKADNISNNNVSILGMPKENDWVLNSLAFDKSLIRDYLSYEISRNMGNYAAQGVYCEVIINGVYQGLYILMEKLKIDDNRIDIQKITTTDIKYPNVTGGYVTKTDKTTSGEPVAWSMSTYIGGNVQFFHDSPKPTQITTEQNTYIYNQFMLLKNAMYAQNSSIINGYPSVIDIPTFVDLMLMNEFSSNPDGYFYSTFFHKDRSGKLRAGPIWDFNLTYGNDIFEWGFDRSHTDVWQFDNGDNTGPKFWKDLYNNTIFKCYLSKRWLELSARNQPLNVIEISNRIDQLVKLVSEAAVREQARWNRVGDQAAEIRNLKTWLQTRTIWLNARLNNCSACSNVVVPALVISKIHYNPVLKISAVSDSLEFIEITNNSAVTVNLTGIYFRQLGVTFQFPASSTIDANAKIILASNAKTYELNYGKKPFGQYTRNLSNKSENLVLADAFGNVIDRVEYTDSIPWPVQADGGGSCLELVNLNSDNNLASNWKATSIISDIEMVKFENLINIYPIPAQNSITVSCGNLAIKSYIITDIFGRIISISDLPNSNTINIVQLQPNIYFIKFEFVDGFSVLKKIIKI
jgi:spore coat protein CotH